MICLFTLVAFTARQQNSSVKGCPSLPFQCLLEYFPDSEGFQVGSVMAVLAVIGGIDGRLRLGGQVIHEEYGEGTVTRITPKGRITVQFHEMRTCRVCLLSHLKPVCVLLHFMSKCTSVHLFPFKQTQWAIMFFLSFPQLPAVNFSVQNLPFTEPMLGVWAQLVSLAGSKLEKQRMKKSASRGLTGTETNFTHRNIMLS